MSFGVYLHEILRNGNKKDNQGVDSADRHGERSFSIPYISCAAGSGA